MNKNKFRHFFERFVTDFGGEVLQEVNVVKYADFLFSADRVVAELKTLEEDRQAEHAKRIQELSLEWRRRGLLSGYGRFTIHLQKLPPKCQRDWLDLLEPPVYKLIRDANRQIRSTKKHLNLDGYKGLLLIANDGNFLHTDPVNYMILVARMTQKKEKDGTPRFPHIDGVVYFSYRIASRAEGVPFWVPGTTALPDPAMRDFQEKLTGGWFSYLSKLTGQPVKTIIPANLGMEVSVPPQLEMEKAFVR